jgi:phosphoglycerate kinase
MANTSSTKTGSYHPELKLSVEDVDLAKKTVLLRVDYDVSVGKYYKIGATYRIDRSLKTIDYLIEQGCKIIICSHLGNPKKDEENYLNKYSLKRVSLYLSSQLGRPVKFIDNPFSAKAKKELADLKSGEVALLENLRFWEGEKKNSATFAKKLADATGAKFFVQDAFAVLHRKHASTDAITKYLPTVAGYLVLDEFKHFNNFFKKSEHPIMGIVGGAKLMSKIEALESLVDKCDDIFVGGAVANVIYYYSGVYTGDSLMDSSDEMYEMVKKIKAKVFPKEDALDRSELPRCRVRHGRNACFLCSQHFKIPLDIAVSTNKHYTQQRMTVECTMVAPGEMILDMGDVAILKIKHYIGQPKTVFWNGVFGYVEMKYFRAGTETVAKYLADLYKQGSKIYIGGGDTANFLYELFDDPTKHFTYISTGGGATLDLIDGLPLPGYESILNKA